MPVTLSIKNAPDDVVRRLRQRAERNHRSLQGELLAIIEEAAGAAHPMTPDEILATTGAIGLRTPAEATGIVRASRDGR